MIKQIFKIKERILLEKKCLQNYLDLDLKPEYVTTIFHDKNKTYTQFPISEQKIIDLSLKYIDNLKYELNTKLCRLLLT